MYQRLCQQIRRMYQHYGELLRTKYKQKTPHLRGVENDCELLRMNFWCPRTESNRYLMITNQLHDLHATGAWAPARHYSPIMLIRT